jgi:threonine synthase
MSQRVTYFSTRGGATGMKFEEVVLGGLANDRGLYIPEIIPQLSMERIENMRNMNFADLAFEVIRQFVGPEDIPPDALQDIINRSFRYFYVITLVSLVVYTSL